MVIYIETESRIVVAKGWRRREYEELVFNGYIFLLGHMRKVLEMDSGNSCTIL